MEIVHQRAHNVDVDSKAWKISNEERRGLYKTVAHALDKIDDTPGAFKILSCLMKEMESATEADIAAAQSEAHRCVILAIKSKNAINFEELLALKAIKQLATKDKETHEFFTLFTRSNATDFKGQVAKFADIMKKVTRHESISESFIV